MNSMGKISLDFTFCPPKVVVMRRSRIIIPLVTVACLALPGCGKKESDGSAVPVVRTIKVSRAPFSDNSSYSGVVCGRYESKLSFQVGGRIIKRFVEVGTAVRAGQALMQLDQSDLRDQMEASGSQVEAARADLKLAEDNLRRYKELFDNDAVSKAEFERYQNAHAVAAAKLASLKKNYDVGANQFRYGRLVAPANGVITEIAAEAGQVIAPGQSVMTLVRHGEREVQVSVPENRINEIRSARRITITFWANPDLSVRGRVREISPVSDRATRTYTVRVSLIAPPPAVKLGMTATVSVSFGAARPAVFVPVSAIFQTGDRATVWAVSSERARRRVVTLGPYGDNEVEVRDGLADGDVVVTAGVHKLVDGQRVRVMESSEMFK